MAGPSGHGRPPRGASQTIALAEIDRPAPSGPPRFPVDALTLTAEGSSSEDRGDRRGHLRQQTSPASAARRRSSYRRSRDPSPRLEPSPPPRRAGRGSRSRRECANRPERAGRDRPGRPLRAARRPPREARRRRRNGPARRGAPSNRRPPSTRGSPGPNGWLSVPSPTRPAGGTRPVGTAGRAGARPGTRPPSSIAWARSRSTGTVTLRFVASPVIAWTAILQASSREASSVQVSGPSGG